MSTFDYIMSKREKAENLKDQIKSLEERIKNEEAKQSSPSIAHSSPRNSNNRTKVTQEYFTKGSNRGEQTVETSKESLLISKLRLPIHENSKEDDCHENFRIENEIKVSNENEIGFRNTSSSVFRQVNNSGRSKVGIEEICPDKDKDSEHSDNQLISKT
jgi:hypothetical protein